LWRDEQVLGPYWLIYARDALDPTQQKYSLSDAAPGTPLEVMLHVGFARWPMERCLEDKKSELGLSHFEVRNYPSIHRHFYLTHVSHLVTAQQTSRLRGEKPGGCTFHCALCIVRISVAQGSYFSAPFQS
jgi:SRSO17 transposase